MDFVFWQKSPSIHQSVFLRNLSLNHNVTLIVEEDRNKERAAQGWYIADFGNVNIITAQPEQAKKLIKHLGEPIHVFSGFFSVPLATAALKIVSSKPDSKFGFIMEPFNNKGWKGSLKSIKYYFYIQRYKEKALFLLSTGHLGTNLYTRLTFPEDKVFSWGYFTEEQNHETAVNNTSLLPSVLYIGQLIQRKNILGLIDALLPLQEQIAGFTIIGSGPLQKEIEKISNQHSKIKHIQKVPNQEIGRIIATHDLLVLPSYFDGWGAVVNEALQQGTPCVASERCGSSTLLDNGVRGESFSFNKDREDLKEVLKKRLQHGKVPLGTRKKIKLWSKKTISGESAAEYFIRAIKYTQDKIDDKPRAPWLLHNI
jgi:glycosyltransferase involved in cell wall biosynthesis